MTDAEARDEIRAAIAHYDALGKCWLSVVTYLGIRWCFGSFNELIDYWRPRGGGRKRQAV